jgi:hypothetical protein
MINWSDLTQPNWLIIDNLMMPKKTGIFAACGSLANSSWGFATRRSFMQNQLSNLITN